MATALQPLTDVQALPPSSCPRCLQQQTQAEMAALLAQAQVASLPRDCQKGPHKLAHPADEQSLSQ